MSPPRSFDHIPIIDLAPVTAGGIGPVAKAMRAASRTAGFFYVANHGVPEETTEAALAAARSFFARPESWKRRVAVNALHRGFLGMGEAKLRDDADTDRKESYVWGLELDENDPDVRAGKPLMGPQPVARGHAGDARRALRLVRGRRRLRPDDPARAGGRTRPARDLLRHAFRQAARTRRAGSLPAPSGRRRRPRLRRRRAHRLWRHHAGPSGRCRRTRGPEPRGRLAPGSPDPRHPGGQYRRSDGALDQRRLRLDPPPGSSTVPARSVTRWRSSSIRTSTPS